MSRIGTRAVTHAVSIALVGAALSLVACAPAASTTKTDAGAALLERRCSVCHTLDRVTSAQKDEAGWNATIDRMRANGAVVSEQEQKDLVAYLLSL